MKDRTSSFVLKPYEGELTGILRIASWLVIPALGFFCLFAGFFYALTTPYMIPQYAAILILLCLIVIWSLPDMDVGPTKLLGKFFFSFVVAALLWPNYLAIVLPGMPWITAIRIIGLPMTFILLICISVSKNFRETTANTLRSIPGLWKLIVIFMVIQIVSIVFSKSIGDSMNALVDTMVSCTVLFFVACFVFNRPGAAQLWATIIWMSAVALCLVGLWEAKLQHVPWADHIPKFLQVHDEYVYKILKGTRRLGSDKYRLQGVKSTSLGMAEYLALTSAFVIHFAMGPYKLWVRVAAMASLPFIFYTILETDARLGVVGFFVAVLLYALYWGVMRWQYVKGSILGPAVVLAYPVLFAAFMAATFFVGRLHNMVWGAANTRYSDAGRGDQVAKGWPKIWSHPWGYGIGQGAEVLDYHNEAGVLTIDTYYLLVALDYGVIGFLVYYSAILVVIWACGKQVLNPRQLEPEETLLVPAGIALSAFFIIKSIFSQTENHTFQYMMMGMAAALIYRAKTRNAAAAAAEAALNPAPAVEPPRRMGLAKVKFRK